MCVVVVVCVLNGSREPLVVFMSALRFLLPTHVIMRDLIIKYS